MAETIDVRAVPTDPRDDYLNQGDAVALVGVGLAAFKKMLQQHPIRTWSPPGSNRRLYHRGDLVAVRDAAYSISMK
jgi:hypothetical protein